MLRPRLYLPLARISRITLTMSSKTTKVRLSPLYGSRYMILMAVVLGTVHGFAARPNLSMPDVKAGFEGALEQAESWFQKTIV